MFERVLHLSWRSLCHIDTSLLICSANQWTSVYMIETSVMKELILRRCFIHLVVGFELCTTGIWRRSVNHLDHSDHSFSTYARISKKRSCAYQGVRNFSFWAYVSHMYIPLNNKQASAQRLKLICKPRICKPSR